MKSSRSRPEPSRPNYLSILPVEIRRAIYCNLVPELNFIYEPQQTIHLSQAHNGAVRLSRCCNPNTYYLDVGLERRGFRLHATKDDPVWQRRLLSTWGPHWRCEEEIGQRPEVEGLPLLSVCRTTRCEFAEVLAQHARFEITSLQDIERLTNPQSAISIEGLILPHVFDLSITLNLPFGLFQEVQTPTSLLGDQTPDSINALVRLWHSFPRSIKGSLPRLRFLSFWADHDEPKMWSAQSMAAFLEAVNKLVFWEEGDNNGDDNSDKGPSLQRVRVVLPRRNPFEEIEIRWPKIALVIQEVRRLKYRVRKDEKGGLEVYYVDEWPVAAEPVPLLTLEQVNADQAAGQRMQH